tara:strand:+ start:305 stop:475 length:171 start_codon:yes stop_codon:yes gene_type:complete
MQVGDLVKIWLTEDESEVGVIIDMDKNTIPEKVFVRTLEGRMVDGWEDECEVLNAA